MPNDQGWNPVAASPAERIVQDITLSATYRPLPVPEIEASAASSTSNTIALITPSDADVLYRVLRSTEGGPYVEIAVDVPVDLFPYPDPNLTADTTYSYQVEADNGHGKAMSTVESAKTPADVSGTAPTKPVYTIDAGSSSALFVVSDDGGATSFEHQIRLSGGTFGTWQAGKQPTGLTAETGYDGKLRGLNEYGASPDGDVVAFTTSAAGVVPAPTDAPTALYFEDDFESGDLSKTATTGTELWSWGGYEPGVDSNGAYSGTYSSRLNYGPDALGEDSRDELSFKLGKVMSEIWLEYYIWYPSNYFHRSDSPSNNKFLQLSYNGKTSQILTIESLVQDSAAGNSKMKRFMSTSENLDGSSNWPLSQTTNPDVQNFIGAGSEFAVRLGQWTQVRVHYRASPDGIANGIAEIYFNGTLFKALEWPFWDDQFGGAINGGYINGWSNSGFTELTTIRHDRVQVFESYPGWGQ